MGISWPTLAAAFVSQVLVALITVQLALGRFRQEKWWERKYEAYSEILISLHRLRKSYFADLEDYHDGTEPSEERKAESRADYKLSSDDLMRHGDLGDFLISPEAVSLLKQYAADTRAASKSENYHDYLDENLDAVQRFLSSLLPVAKADLKASPSVASLGRLRRRFSCLL